MVTRARIEGSDRPTDNQESTRSPTHIHQSHSSPHPSTYTFIPPPIHPPDIHTSNHPSIHPPQNHQTTRTGPANRLRRPNAPQPPPVPVHTHRHAPPLNSISSSKRRPLLLLLLLGHCGCCGGCCRLWTRPHHKEEEEPRREAEEEGEEAAPAHPSTAAGAAAAAAATQSPQSPAHGHDYARLTLASVSIIYHHHHTSCGALTRVDLDRRCGVAGPPLACLLACLLACVLTGWLDAWMGIGDSMMKPLLLPVPLLLGGWRDGGI
jgi:hypothetical protein